MQNFHPPQTAETGGIGTHGHTPRRLALTFAVAAVGVLLAPHGVEAATAPTDTPIDPIPASVIELAVSTAEWQPVCASYAETVTIMYGFVDDPAMQTVLVEMVDQYMLNSFETGMGVSSELTVEAEALLVAEMHACI